MADMVFFWTIGDIEVEVIRKRKKNITLYVLPPDGKVRVTAPVGASQAGIREFLLKKRLWLQKTVLKFKEQSLLPKLRYASGESHPLWGEDYRLTVVPAKGKAHVDVSGRDMLLFAEADAGVERKTAVMAEFYRTQVKARAPHLLDTWGQRMGVSISGWQVKNTRSRWGSCHVPRKKINLSLRLAMKPPSCLEYTIVHELCHLLVPDHSPAFYELLGQFLPDWQERRARCRLSEFRRPLLS
ncbi:MAG: M48 family metallopeptidase [Desulfovibrio sp.]|jgi:predicted metal-dependent hydrolase|nr:M48 family metallopeptidase [Desulfovibrio sp.]